jgi:hypothetical protein
MGGGKAAGAFVPAGAFVAAGISVAGPDEFVCPQSVKQQLRANKLT